MLTSWKIAVDWTRDGNYVDETLRVISANWFLGVRKPYQETADNSMLTLVLSNADRRYSPQQGALLADGTTSNPLQGKVRAFKPIRVESKVGLATPTIHWEGWIEVIQPAVNKYGQRTVKILASGPLQFFKAAEADLPLQENKRTDEILLELIKRVVNPPALNRAWVLGRIGNTELGISSILADLSIGYALESGRVTLGMAGDNWVKEGGLTNAPKNTYDVFQAIQEITAAEHGKFFFDRKGKAIFWNRHHTLLDAAPVTTFDDVMQDMVYNYSGIEEIKNEVVVVCHPRTISPTADVLLWELVPEQIIRVQPGETKTFFVKYEDESKNRIGARDVTVTDVVFEQGNATITLEAQANGAEIKLVNSGSAVALVKSLKVRGRKITDQNEIEVKSIDQGSMVDYGRRVMRINLPSIDNIEQAQYIADFEKERRKVPRGEVNSITLKSHGLRGGNQHTQQLERTIGDVIRVKETQTNHQQDYFIVGEAHELTMGGTLWATTWYLEPVPAVMPWRLDEGPAPGTGRSILGQSTRLAY